MAVTPNGYADGIASKDGEDYFVLPEEKQMLMTEFLDTLDVEGLVLFHFLIVLKICNLLFLYHLGLFITFKNKTPILLKILWSYLMILTAIR